MSHFAKLQKEFAAKEQQLKQHSKTIEELEELTQQLEAKKRALAAKSEELNGRSDEVTGMKKRLDVLSDLAAPLDAAMKSKPSSEDALQHVLEAALRSGHLTSSDIFQRTVNIAKGMDGKTHDDVLSEVLADLVTDKHGLDAAVGWAIANFASANDVVKSALSFALSSRANAADLLEGVAKTAYDMLAEKARDATPQPAKETPIVNLPKENSPAGTQYQATPLNKTSLRGQAEDFKPRSMSNGFNGTSNGTQKNGAPNDGGGGWESFVRENGAGDVGGNPGVSPGSRGTPTGSRGWSSIPGWGL